MFDYKNWFFAQNEGENRNMHLVRNRRPLVAMLLMAFVLMSCSTSNLGYISDVESGSQEIVKTYSLVIHPGDKLYIYVYSQMPEAATPFNLDSRTTIVEESRTNNVSASNFDKVISEVSGSVKERDFGSYLVTEEGFISFPVIGNLRVVGITQDSLGRLIENRLKEGDYVSDPVVTVSLLNFRVSVIGEVNTPRELHIDGNRLTILEALAMCGDATIYGERDKVVVVREKKGIATPILIDLTKKSMFDSEVYYLQSNDIVYVEPNKVKKRESNRNENSVQYVTFWVAVGAMVANLFRVYVMS